MLSNLNTCQIGKEIIEGVGINPNISIKIINATFNEVQKYKNLEQIHGTILDSKEILDTTKEFMGNIEFIVDEDNLGYFVQMANAKTSSSLISGEYVNVFNFENKNDVGTYTIEISKGDFLQRFVGCKVNSLNIKNQDGILIATCEIYAKNGITMKSVSQILDNTKIYLDDVRSYIVGDEIELRSRTSGVSNQVLIISGIDTTNNFLTVGTISNPGDYHYVVLKTKTVTYTGLKKAKFFGKSNLVIDGVSLNNLDFEFVLSNNLENVYQIGDRSPSLILQGGRSITLKNTFHFVACKNQLEAFLNGKEVEIYLIFETNGTKYIKFGGKGKFSGGQIDLSSNSQLTLPTDMKLTEGSIEIRGNVNY